MTLRLLPLVMAFLPWLACQPAALAIIVYEAPGRLTTLPVLEGGVKPGWQYIGNYNGFGGVPIGPRHWISATHTTAASMNFWYNNAGESSFINYQGTRVATDGDLAVAQLNANQPSFTAWAPVWSGTSNITADLPVYMFGYGTLRGTEIPGDGWNWGAADFAMSYGTNNLEAGTVTVVGNTQFRMRFNQPTVSNGLPGTEGIFSTGDSGSGLFAFNTANDRWELIGINSAVERVSATSGGALLSAALYDARGYYAGTDRINTTYPLSSFSIALPYYEEFLTPYVPVPEPSGWPVAAIGVAALASAGLSAARRRASAGLQAAAAERTAASPRQTPA